MESGMEDKRLTNLNQVLSKAITPQVLSGICRWCKKPYHQEDLRERYCGDSCRVKSWKFKSKVNKKKSRKSVKGDKYRGKIRVMRKIIENV